MTMWQITAKQLTNLVRRVNAYNRVVNSWADSGIYSSTPLETSVTQEMEYISDNRSYNERMAQLGRALPSKNRHAADPVFFKGLIVPQYMRNETRNIVRQENRQRANYRASLFPLWDYMKPSEQAAAISNKNLQDLDEEDYIGSGTDYDDLISVHYMNMPKKAEIYIDVWIDNGGDEDIPEIIRYLADNDPDGFRKLMESPDIEKDIEYIYPDGLGGYTGAHTGWNYKRGSAYKTEQQVRFDKAAWYWREQYMDYQNREGYFA